MNALLAFPVVQNHIEAAGHRDNELVQSFVGVAAAFRTAWHVIQIVNPLYCERYLMTSFDEGQVSPWVGDFRQFNNLATLNAHVPLPFKQI